MDDDKIYPGTLWNAMFELCKRIGTYTIPLPLYDNAENFENVDPDIYKDWFESREDK